MLGKNKQQTDAGPLIPSQPTLQNLKQAASRCKACDLWRKGTQTVFGEGSPRAAMMLIGEQPGDKEDIAGHPFVGPAGRILDEALQAAAIDRSVVYVTNVVKHFNWVPAERGKRRIHKKPRHFEIEACRPWLEAEIALTRPQVIVCLGATAAQALLGRNFSVMKQRAQFVPSPLARWVMATVHPSSILRAPDAAARERQKQDFIADLRVAARQMKNLQKAP